MQPARHTVTCLLAVLWLSLLNLSAQAPHSTNNPIELSLKKFQLAPGLKLELFAAEPLLENPVSFSIDEHGRFFVAETHRYKESIFDITKQLPWLLNDLSFRTVADREVFLRREFVGTNFSTLTNSSELVRLVEDRDGDGRAETSRIFATGFNQPTSGTAAGVLTRKGEVWFASIPELWKLSGTATSTSTPSPIRKTLFPNFGPHISVTGHDLHGLIMGPDGRLYFSVGDRGFAPPADIKGFGFTTAFLRRVLPDTGAVFRCNPDGSDFEVFCIGLRNPQELAFDAYGNLFTVDNDTAGEDKSRLLHLVEGGDYGWRISYQHMRGFGPWVQEGVWRGGIDDVLPWSGEVAQGPAGFAFYPGTGLPEKYRDHFFICDFPGGIWSFTVKPRGASFEVAQREKFLWNCWPTDVVFGPDGALYVSDWVEGWQQPNKGRLYRITDPAQTNSVKLAEVRRLLAEGMEKRNEAELSRLLTHDAMQARLEAQWEFARRVKSDKDPVVKELVRIALNSRITIQRLHAIWGLGQLARKLDDKQMVEELTTLLTLLDDKDADVRAHVCELFRQAGYMNTLPLMAKLTVDKEPRVRLKAVIAATGDDMSNPAHYRLKQTVSEKLRDAIVPKLDAMKNKITGGGTVRGTQLFTWTPPYDQVEKLLQDADQSNDSFLRHATVTFLAMQWQGAMKLYGSITKAPWAQVYWRFATNANSEVRLGALLALRRNEDPAITKFLHDSDPRLVLEAARAINDVPIPAAYPQLAALLTSSISPRPQTPDPAPRPASSPAEQILRRALNAHFRLGQSTNAQALANFSTDSSTADALRAEALFLLGNWAVQPASPGNVPHRPATVEGHGSTPVVNPENWPGWFDRCVGLWRPLPPRDAQPAIAALRPHLASLLRATGTNTVLATIAAAEKLALTEAAPLLADLLKQPSAPTPIRVASLGALASSAFRTSHSALFSESVSLALADTNSALRREAVKWAGAANPIAAVPLLENLLATEKDTRLGQAALTALGQLPGAEADAVLARQLASLVEGKLSAELKLELLEAATKRTAASIVVPLQRFNDSLPNDDPLAPFRPTLAGGDTAEGRRLFNEHAGAQCLRCHAIRGTGGTVGPDLAGVGNRLTREQLLESIVLPNRQIAAGFENVTLVLRNSTSHVGLVKSETANELVLDSPEDSKLTVKKTDIDKRLRGLSAMPEGLTDQITRRELRDLVEYLASLK